MTSHGQKVTTDPRSKDPIHEGVGVVTSDSLAGESMNQGGHFGEGNPHAGVSKQPSRSTNTNTTDTSNATRLDPAHDAGERQAREGYDESSEFNSGRGSGKEGGVGPTYATAAGGGGGHGGGRQDHEDRSGSGHDGSDSNYSSSNTRQGDVPQAPLGSYAGSAELAREPGERLPKGKNLKEGGFDGNEPNASEGNTEIGTDKDPGRQAEANYQLRDAQSGYDAGGKSRQGNVSGTGVYDELKSDEQV